MLQPIANVRRDDFVYKQLLDNIKAGVWKSGDKLPTENELCKELNVSRVTIRAALQRLKSLGLVESQHGRGTFVCHNEDLFDYSGFSDTLDLTPREYRETIQLREAIEKRAVQNIVENGPVGDTDTIFAAYRGMEEAAQNFDYKELTKYDMMFHTAIIVASDNSHFTQVMRIFQEEYYRVLLETNKLLMRDYPDMKKVKSHFDECLLNHKNLLEALFQSQGDAMEEQERFLQRNRERVEYFFQKHQASEEGEKDR